MFCCRAFVGDVCVGFLAYLVTSAPVFLGVFFGITFVPLNRDSPNNSKPSFLTACSRFDGVHYTAIVRDGYSYNPLRRSDVAFFPGYPIVGRLGVLLTGWDATATLLVVSNLMLMGAFIVFSAYLRARFPQASPRERFFVLALFGLWPAGFFFRMTYSESSFLFFTLLVLLGMERRWPLEVLAFFAGLVTGVRPVGLAVTAALLWYILSDKNRGSLFRRSVIAGVCFPIAAWGLTAYMIYQYYYLNTPFAFAQTQDHWSYLAPSERDLGQKIESLLLGEPIWGVYTSDPVRNWMRLDGHGNPFFSLFFWNPILFVGALLLVLLGAAKSWLSGPEITLGLCLLAIPYATRAYEMSMAAHGRFAAVVFPAYIVLARLLVPLPQWVTWAVIGVFTMLLMTWTALYAAGHLFF